MNQFVTDLHSKEQRALITRLNELNRFAFNINHLICHRERKLIAKERDIEGGKRLKSEMADLDQKRVEVHLCHINHFEVEQSLFSEAISIPNETHPEVEDQERIIKYHGEKPSFSFTPKNHVELGEKLDLIDFESAATISGHLESILTHFLRREILLFKERRRTLGACVDQLGNAKVGLQRMDSNPSSRSCATRDL